MQCYVCTGRQVLLRHLCKSHRKHLCALSSVIPVSAQAALSRLGLLLCFVEGHSFGLLLGTEAPVMMPNSVDLSFLFFSLLRDTACLAAAASAQE